MFGKGEKCVRKEDQLVTRFQTNTNNGLLHYLRLKSYERVAERGTGESTEGGFEVLLSFEFVVRSTIERVAAVSIVRLELINLFNFDGGLIDDNSTTTLFVIQSLRSGSIFWPVARLAFCRSLRFYPFIGFSSWFEILSCTLYVASKKYVFNQSRKIEFC